MPQSTHPPTPVWLDCDPGHDDAIAILLAGYSPQLHLLGISTVAGNQSVEKVTENARRVLYAAGLAGVEVVQGQGRPVMRDPVACAEIHGDSGLDGPSGGPLLPPVPVGAGIGPHSTGPTGARCTDTDISAPAAAGPLQPRGVVVMAERIAAAAAQRAQRVHVVATGALTNVALLLTLFPEIVDRIEIVFMGGALGTGNTGPSTEFNIQVDPEAAAMVMRSGARITMVPLEVTHTALVGPEVATAVLGAAPGGATPFRQAMHDLLHFFAKTEVFDFVHPPLHDPCAVAYVIDRSLFKASHLRVDVETHSVLSAGQTVTDLRRTTGRAPNATVCLAMDVAAFWRLVLDAIAAADARSPLNNN
ncbi:Inosine-uridine-preferring nucleoside hydrolase-like protein [Auxenochlorella protothecoides]|uniref:Inosine-uridine-preferring nucleoside hydrolase-like protein n=1 Tax=Auxenochlorella protothecoides TaxID=3075 RepID=A0A087SCZ3_AUXPR|nr:Inosine-uridine-preferring nucleoside hydrolase-like protein [Auxenochlorella protothecoides]KFM23597.1 Inosine-uridine-preferring nucleoside hydrolase-like protein [Auxenochlorella protothecoides]RMZ52068.1 hypothetical protein APUTEX25_001262 [Auxenochlorella protothecoides]|eukprot:RMZ52068.1 hypothetical protein APUTEX25_001262 [Auxenochlorella protothecoides]